MPRRPAEGGGRLAALLGHRVTRNAAALGVVQVANYLVPLLLLPFLTRQLGMAAFGTVAVVLAAIQLAFVITDYGFSLSATLDVSLHRDDRGYLNRKIGAVFAAKGMLLAALLALFGLALLLHEPLRAYRPFFVAAFLGVIGQAFQPLWLFQGLERMRQLAVYLVASKLLYAGLVLALVRGPEDALAVIYCWGVAQVAGALLGLGFMGAQGFGASVPTWAGVIEELRGGAGFFLSRLAVAVYTSVNSLFLGTQGTVGVAAYAVCEQVYKAGQNVTAPLTTALYPYMARQRHWTVFFRALGLGGLCLALGCLLLGVLAEPVLGLLFGAEYRAAAPVLRVFLVTVLVNYLGVAFGYSAYAALGRVQVANVTVMLGGVLHLGLLGLLLVLGEATPLGVALATLATESLVMAMRVAGVCWLRRSAREGMAP